MGEEKEKEKVKIDVNNPADLKKLREMQAKRGARAVNQGRQKALNTAVQIATPIGLGATIGTAFAYPFATVLGLGGSYLGSVIGKEVAPEKYEREGEVIGGTLGGMVTGGFGSRMDNYMKDIGGGFSNYWNTVKNNYNQIGRYTLDNLYPAGYFNIKRPITSMRKWGTTLGILGRPLIETPPIFSNGRKPKWYRGTVNDEVRFENGAKWAGIPEEEIPQPLLLRNMDGTYRLYPRAITENTYGPSGVQNMDLNKLETVEAAKAAGKLVGPDHLGTVGGLHSDYKFMAKTPDGHLLWEMVDEQKLNPQWGLASLGKLFFPKNSRPWRAIHKWGGKDWGEKILGYKPFTYRQGIAITPDREGVAFFDPSEYEAFNNVWFDEPPVSIIPK